MKEVRKLISGSTLENKADETAIWKKKIKKKTWKRGWQNSSVDKTLAIKLITSVGSVEATGVEAENQLSTVIL